MDSERIAVLFDAENINCSTAQQVLRQLTARGEVPIRRAVGDFSLSALSAWIDCARDNGIELVLQPGLGKGKNGADIRLVIEAMDIVHQCRINTVALVTRDRDFTPLALRLRHADVTVLGFAQTEPHASFRAACSEFKVIGTPAPVKAAKPQPTPATSLLDNGAVARLRQIARSASQNGPVLPVDIMRAIVAAAPELATKISGQGKFLKTLVAHGIVERVGSSAALLVQAPDLRRAS